MNAKEISSLIDGPIVPIADTSYDSTNGVSMSYSTLPVYNFDSVKEVHTRSWGLSKHPKSADALHFDEDGSAAFIEFKNCAIRTGKRIEVRRKMYDSLLILEDIAPKGLEFSHKHCDFILVYNAQKNSTPDEDVNPAQRISPSSHRVDIAENLLAKAGEEFIRFGLEDFQDYCYRAVHTYSEEEFEKRFVQNARSILPAS